MFDPLSLNDFAELTPGRVNDVEVRFEGEVPKGVGPRTRRGKD